jgi:hypothetical protein
MEDLSPHYPTSITRKPHPTSPPLEQTVALHFIGHSSNSLNLSKHSVLCLLEPDARSSHWRYELIVFVPQVAHRADPTLYTSGIVALYKHDSWTATASQQGEAFELLCRCFQGSNLLSRCDVMSSYQGNVHMCGLVSYVMFLRKASFNKRYAANNRGRCTSDTFQLLDSRLPQNSLVMHFSELPANQH